MSEQEKDLEILLLRQQVSKLQRNRDKPVCATRVEKLTLAIFTTKLKEISNRSASQLGELIRLFQPKTVWVGIETWYAASGRLRTKGETEKPIGEKPENR